MQTFNHNLILLVQEFLLFIESFLNAILFVRKIEACLFFSDRSQTPCLHSIAVYLFLFTLEHMTPSSITRTCMQNLLGVHEIKRMNTHSCSPSPRTVPGT